MNGIPRTHQGHEAAWPVEAEPVIQQETRGHDDERSGSENEASEVPSTS